LISTLKRVTVRALLPSSAFVYEAYNLLDLMPFELYNAERPKTPAIIVSA
jgi:hypothetical protein